MKREYPKLLTQISQPYQYGEVIGDLPRRMLREIRKKLGLPASRDVGMLSKMIRKLHAAAESFIGEPVYIAKASIPDFASALYSEDIYESFEYLQLSYLEIQPWQDWKPIYTSDAAYAAYDTRICSNYTKSSPCDGQSLHHADPIHFQDYPHVLIAYYTRTELEVRIEKTAYTIIQAPDSCNSSMGHNSLQDAPDKDSYWDEVRQTIRGSRQYRMNDNVTQLLVTGDAAQSPEFRQVLKEETDSMFEKELETFDEYPVFAAARGVARLVMVELWKQNHRTSIETNVAEEL